MSIGLKVHISDLKIHTSSISKPLNKGPGERHGAVQLEEKTSRQVHTVGVGHSGKGR